MEELRQAAAAEAAAQAAMMRTAGPGAGSATGRRPTLWQTSEATPGLRHPASAGPGAARRHQHRHRQHHLQTQLQALGWEVAWTGCGSAWMPSATGGKTTTRTRRQARCFCSTCCRCVLHARSVSGRQKQHRQLASLATGHLLPLLLSRQAGARESRGQPWPIQLSARWWPSPLLLATQLPLPSLPQCWRRRGQCQSQLSRWRLTSRLGLRTRRRGRRHSRLLRRSLPGARRLLTAHGQGPAGGSRSSSPTTASSSWSVAGGAASRLLPSASGLRPGVGAGRRQAGALPCDGTSQPAR